MVTEHNILMVYDSLMANDTKQQVTKASCDDVSLIRNKRVNERIILQCTFQEEVQFPCKISGQSFTGFTCFDISIIMYCQD